MRLTISNITINLIRGIKTFADVVVVAFQNIELY